MDDHNAILNLLARYAHTVDGRDFERFGELLSADVVFEVGEHRMEGRATVVDTISKTMARSAGGRHVGVNVAVDIDGDRAVATSDFLLYSAACELRQIGRYHDELIKADGVWQFARRRIESQLRPDHPELA